MTEAYNPYSVDDSYEDEEKEVVAAKWNWGKKTIMVTNHWGRGVEESYDFDVTKSDKLFSGRESARKAQICYASKNKS